MKNLFVASILALGLSIPAMAADLVPVDHKGGVTDPMYAGISTCRITSSTGTNAVLCDTGAGIVLAVVGSSVAATDSLVFRDSATANTSSAISLVTDKASLAEEGKIYPRYKNGLSVNALVAPTAPGAASNPSWTIIYRALD